MPQMQECWDANKTSRRPVACQIDKLLASVLVLHFHVLRCCVLLIVVPVALVFVDFVIRWCGFPLASVPITCYYRWR